MLLPLHSSSSGATGRVSEGEGGGPLIWLPPDFDWNPWTQRPPSRLNSSLTSVSIIDNLVNILALYFRARSLTICLIN